VNGDLSPAEESEGVVAMVRVVRKDEMGIRADDSAVSLSM
jgi:hypothetical protein